MTRIYSGKRMDSMNSQPEKGKDLSINMFLLLPNNVTPSRALSVLKTQNIIIAFTYTL